MMDERRDNIRLRRPTAIAVTALGVLGALALSPAMPVSAAVTCGEYRDVAVDATGNSYRLTEICAATNRVVVEKFDVNGNAVTAFGTNGVLTLPALAEATAITVDTTNVYVTGSGPLTNGADPGLVVAFGTNGTPDNDFGTTGTAAIAVPSHDVVLTDVVVDSTGRIITTGGANDDVVVARLDTAGDLDTTFSTDGIATPGLDGNGLGLVATPAGYVIAHGSTPLTISRLTLAGTLDTGFGTSGSVTPAFSGIDPRFTGIGQTTNARIAVGVSTLFGGGVAVLTSTGAPDATFRTGGSVTIDMGGATDHTQFVVGPDGRMYLAGLAYAELTDTYVARVVALTPTGAFDDTFGLGGWKQVSAPWATMASFLPGLDGIALDAARSTLHLVGWTTTDMDGPRPGATRLYMGTTDPLTWSNPVTNSAFVSDSLTITSPGAMRVIADMYVRPSGKLAVLVEHVGDDGYTTFSVEKRRPNGRPDTTFGTNGTYVYPSPRGLDRAGAVEDQRGSILVAGTHLGGESAALMLTRITPDGALDTTFGSGGRRSVATSVRLDPTDIEIDGEGRILVLSRGWSGSAASAVVTRFSRRGSLDRTFGTAGSTSTPIDSCATPTTLQAHGTGYVITVPSGCKGSQPRIVRLGQTGRIDARFAQAGFRSAFANPDRAMQIEALATVGGTNTRPGRLALVVSAGRAGTRLAVLNPSGSLVPSFGQQGSRPIDAAGRRFHLEEASRRRVIVTSLGSDVTRTTYLPTGRRDTSVPIATGPAIRPTTRDVIAIQAGAVRSPVYVAGLTRITRSVPR